MVATIESDEGPDSLVTHQVTARECAHNKHLRYGATAVLPGQ